MKRFSRLLPILFLPWAVFGTMDADEQTRRTANSFKISWKKIVLDKNFRSEGVAVVDVNKDGKPDIIIGDCWYEAPQQPGGEWRRHIIRTDRVYDPLKYSESFACFTDDFSG